MLLSELQGRQGWTTLHKPRKGPCATTDLTKQAIFQIYNQSTFNLPYLPYQ